MHNYVALFYSCNNDHVGFAISVSSGLALTWLWMLAQVTLTFLRLFSLVSCVIAASPERMKELGAGDPIENRLTAGDLERSMSHH